MHIAYTNAETSKVSILNLAPGVNSTQILTTLPGDAFILDPNTLPDDNYSDQWVISEGSVILTVDQATKELRKDQLRAERQPLLEDLDKLFIEMKSQEKDLMMIMNRQEYLRNITDDPAFDTATTVEELDAITISEWTAPASSSLVVCDFPHTGVTENYTLSFRDSIVGFKHVAPITVTLPEISGNMTTYIFKDESGDASTNNVTIVPSGSDTIEGNASTLVDADYQTLRLYCDGTIWYKI